MPSSPSSLWLSGTEWFLCSAGGGLALTALRRRVTREMVSGPLGLVGKKTLYALGVGVNLLLWVSEPTFPCYLQGIGL